MHKSTIFLAILAFFSITVLLESQVSKAPSIAANSLKANSEFFQTSTTVQKEPVLNQDLTKSNFSESQNQTEVLGESNDSTDSSDSNTEGSGFNAQFFKDFLKSNDSGLNQDDSKTSENSNLNQDLGNLQPVQKNESKILKYFAAIDIENLEISLDENQTQIFDVIDLSNENFSSFVNYKYTKSNSLMAKSTEITFEDNTKTDYFYTLMQAVIKSFDGVEINKNNQFQESFYINNPSKPFFVSLVIKDNNKIYCFSYHKDLHEKFKGFYEILL